MDRGPPLGRDDGGEVSDQFGVRDAPIAVHEVSQRYLVSKVAMHFHDIRQYGEPRRTSSAAGLSNCSALGSLSLSAITSSLSKFVSSPSVQFLGQGGFVRSEATGRVGMQRTALDEDEAVQVFRFVAVQLRPSVPCVTSSVPDARN